jgi:hypothetical protein
MVHNRKAIWTIIILLLTLFLLPQGGMAAEVSLELSSNRAMPGNSISALGQAESNTWVSLKILDSQQNIVLFDAVKSDPEGNYQFIFVVPDLPLGSELIVNAGYGNRIASQILTVGEPGAVPLLLSAFTNEAGSMISMEFNQLMADPAGSQISPQKGKFDLRMVLLNEIQQILPFFIAFLYISQIQKAEGIAIGSGGKGQSLTPCLCTAHPVDIRGICC